jgi:hypothetical protein
MREGRRGEAEAINGNSDVVGAGEQRAQRYVDERLHPADPGGASLATVRVSSAGYLVDSHRRKT